MAPEGARPWGAPGGAEAGTHTARLAARSDNEAKYRSRNPVVRLLVRRFLATVGRLAAAEGAERVLEVGCGEGLVLRYLRERHGLLVDGVEPDPVALAAARRRNPQSRLWRGDACRLGVRSGSYDLVLCLEVLEHLAEPAAALRELRRVARRRLILSVPHEPYFRLGNCLRGRHLARLGDPPDHRQHWTRRGFEAFCRRELGLERTVLAFPWVVVVASV